MLESAEFWVAVGFVIFLAGVAKPVWRTTTAGLDARAERIRESLDEAAKLREEAQHLREEAQHLLAEYQRKPRGVAKKCDEIISNAETLAERLAMEAADKIEAALKRREQLAIDKIAQAEAEALQQVRNTTVDVAIAATRRILERRVDAETGKELVDRTIAELAAKLH